MNSLNEEDILSLIQNEYPLINPESSIRGQMSSIELVDFVVWIENQFQIKIAGYEVNDATLSSMTNLAGFIQAKIGS